MGRVWPRHRHRGRPLNAVVRHHVSASANVAVKKIVRGAWASAIFFVAMVVAWGVSARTYHRDIGPLMSFLDAAWTSRLLKFCLGASVTWGPFMLLVNWSRLGLDHAHPGEVALMLLILLPVGAVNVVVCMLVGAMVFGRKGAVWG